MPLNNKPWLYDKMHNVQIYNNKNELVENKLVNISIRHSSFLQIKVRDPKSFVFNYTCDINNAKFNVMRKEQCLEIDFDELGSHLLEMLSLHLEKDMLIKCVLGEHNLNLVFYEKSKIKSLVFLNIELFVTDQKEMFEEMQASIKTQEEALNKCKYENSVLKKDVLHFEKQFEIERNLKNDLNASFKKHLLNIEATYLEKCTQHQNLLLSKIDLFNNKIQTLQQNLTIIKQENHLKCESSARLLQGMESLRLESLENATIINGLKRENLNMENRIKNQDTDIQHYKKLLTQFEEKKQDLCKTIEEQRKDLENSAFIIAQKNSLCEELKKDMEQAKNVIIKYSKHCDAKAQDFENLEKDIKVKENYIAEQEHELKKLTQEFEEYKFNYSQENIDELKEELQKALSTIQNLEKDKRELAKLNTLLTKKISSHPLFN